MLKRITDCLRLKGLISESIKKPVFLFVFIALSNFITAQTDRHGIPAELKQQTVISEPSTMRKGFLRIGVIYSHSLLDKYFDENGQKMSYYGSSTSQGRTYAVSVEYGITDRLEADVSMSYANGFINSTQALDNLYFDTIITVYADIKTRGFGDLNFGFDYQIIKENSIMPSLTALTRVTIPTGEKNITDVKDEFNFNEPAGNGEFNASLDLLLKKIKYPFSFDLRIGAVYYFGGEKIFEPFEETKSFKTGTFIYIDGGINFNLNDWIALENEIAYHNFGRKEVDGEYKHDYIPWNISYNPKLNFQLKRFRLVECVTIPLSGKGENADPAYIFIIQYVF